MRRVMLLSLVLVFMLAGVAFAATYQGDRTDNTFHGTDSLDKMFGGRGEDKLFGEGGLDRLFGQKGADLLVGGSGEDFLDGGPGDDVIYTGSKTSGDKESDEYRCGGGYDTIYVSGKDHAGHNETGNECEVENTY